MKSFLCVISICFISIENLYAKTYYVSSTGDDANSGTIVSPWKTVTYASSIANAGDTVYVKSGSYVENVIIAKSGTEGNPIVFQGYKTTPGDTPPVLVNNANPYAEFLSADMPTFDGGNRANGIGFSCENRKYLVVKNFQIQNYAYGFSAGGPTQDAGNLEIYNVNTMFTGGTNSSYSGYGIVFGRMGTRFSNSNTITNCMVVNSAAEGFGINGNNNTITSCKVYCNENGRAAMDYYMYVCGSYNTFKNCYIERAPGLSHGGHGYSVKTNAEQVVDHGQALPAIAAQYNKFYYCIAKNLGESFCVRHRTAQYNLFYHCKAIGSYTGTDDSPGEGKGIVVRDGASDNVFDGCIAENCYSALAFMDTIEDGDYGTNPSGHPGNNNLIINGLNYNCFIGVNFYSYSIPSDAGNNTIANCIFYKTRYLFESARSCKNMKYIGNIYYGDLKGTQGGFFKGGSFDADILPDGATTYFKNCDFYDIQGMPANFVSRSVGSISADPLFVNPGISDFHLQYASPCIDAGTTLDYVLFDFDSIPRPQKAIYDMGAYEYH